ncbi:CHAD domain-containing protein [Acuticoccus sp. I52.16.1]|uniref:CHAD domain-containing protein n=1 Tax=Acuticoccus sp. I52.16.1 TaxID=2928472 RepID=UPI001FCFA243|nr:CHAD domain-containing protein [Acuticoccus sp. I52.16.1]UOM33290.1 CHAD domain-containing protein [Acuticoccus sp. I52.16.1]
MSFQFKSADASLQDGVRRVARSQIRRALEEAAATTDPAEAVHSVRKRCKKVRGLIRLVRPGLRGYGAKNAALRDAARPLSGVRDTAVMVETYDKLAKAFPDRLDRAASATVRAHLVDARRAAHVDDAAFGDAMAEFRSALAALLDEIATWKVDGKAADVVAEGAGRVAKDATKALEAALKKPTPDRLHELRKQVKYHTTHIRLLREVWPGPMKAVADELSYLGDLLGDERDLALFVETLRAGPLAPELTADVIALAVQHRAAVQAEALALAQRAFADEPKAVAERIEMLWRVWRRGVSAPAEISGEGDAGAASEEEPADPGAPVAGTEIERKFMVVGDTWRDAVRETMALRQAYIANTETLSIRVRIKNDSEATLTVKSAAMTLARTEVEFKIPLGKAEALMSLATGLTIEKRRHVVPVGGIDVEVDEFVTPDPALVMAEVELSRPDAPLPVAAWLGREVTGNPRYYGATMAAAVRPAD